MVFSIPSYLCLGDRPQHALDARAQGLNFVTVWPKSGHLPDALFQKEFQHPHAGDRGGGGALASQQKQITPTAFLPVGPPQKGEGLGSYFGALQPSPFPHMPDHPQTRGPQPFPTQMPRQILTSPGKLGSYGTPGIALSEIGNDYIATIYDQPRINAKKEREMWRSRMPAAAFKPCGRRGFTFDEGLLTGASTCYMMTKPFMQKREVLQMKHFIIDRPWRPAGYIEDKPTNMEYWEDPYGGFDPRQDAKSRVKKPSDAVFLTGFRGDNFWYTQSIVFKRL